MVYVLRIDFGNFYSIYEGYNREGSCGKYPGRNYFDFEGYKAFCLLKTIFIRPKIYDLQIILKFQIIVCKIL